jgi:membrane protein
MSDSRADFTPRDSMEQAGSPAAFSKEWWQKVWLVLKQSVKSFMDDSGPQWAAAISYYALLSAFPLMLAIVSIGMFFVPEQTMTALLAEVLGDFIPEGEDEVQAVIEGAMAARVGVSTFSILFLLWSGSRVFGVLTRGLNIAYDVDEPYGFIKRTGIELLMLFSIGLLFVAALLSRILIGLLIQELDLSLSDQVFLSWGVTQLLPFVLLLLSFFLIYRYVPRRRVDWKAALVGAVFASTMFAVARPLFWFYIDRFAEYELMYGPLAMVIILVFWTWMVSLFVLFGGELTAHIQDILIEGKPAMEVQRRHRLRSPFHNVRHEAEAFERDFRRLEQFLGLRKPEGLRAQAHLGRLGYYRKEMKNGSSVSRRGRLALGGLALLAALSSAVAITRRRQKN